MSLQGEDIKFQKHSKLINFYQNEDLFQLCRLTQVDGFNTYFYLNNSSREVRLTYKQL
jgi:hypothetical protein